MTISVDRSMGTASFNGNMMTMEENIMTMEQSHDSHSEPLITLTALDHAHLSSLARAAMRTMPEAAANLADELDRAQVLAKGSRPIDVVSMGSEVQFRDESSGRVQTVTLVDPSEADIAQGKVSVLTPVGTALIGLRAGASITWETRTGQLKRLTVMNVRRAPTDELTF
jgi:regulator of nucleoside diphosphate kinase